MEGEDREKGLLRLNYVDELLSSVEEEISFLEGGLTAVEEINQEIRENPKDTAKRKFQNFLLKRVGREDLTSEAPELIEDRLSAEERKNISQEAEKLRKKRDELAIEKSNLQRWLYTPEKLAEIQEVERSVGRKIVESKSKTIHKSSQEHLPSNENIEGVELFRHEKQKNGGWIKGFELDKYLNEEGLIDRCFSVDDEIVKNWIKHPETYPEELKKVYPFLWKSQLASGDDRSVAYLVWDGGRVFVSWYWLENAWSGFNPVLLASS